MLVASQRIFNFNRVHSHKNYDEFTHSLTRQRTPMHSHETLRVCSHIYNYIRNRVGHDILNSGDGKVLSTYTHSIFISDLDFTRFLISPALLFSYTFFLTSQRFSDQLRRLISMNFLTLRNIISPFSWKIFFVALNFFHVSFFTPARFKNMLCNLIHSFLCVHLSKYCNGITFHIIKKRS